jgi:peptide subunit release factor 1 (eRF1)
MEIKSDLRDFVGGQCVSLHIHKDDSLGRVTKMLHETYGAVTNNKCSQRTMCQRAITNCLQVLEKYDSIPPNGLLICCGLREVPDGYAMQLSFDIEIPPEASITRTLYIMDTKFHYSCLGYSESEQFRKPIKYYPLSRLTRKDDTEQIKDLGQRIENAGQRIENLGEKIENLGLRINAVMERLKEVQEWIDRPENPFNRV